jgi:predicted metal-binding membrane protein
VEPQYAMLVSVMWWVMMVAMMLPTVAPAVLLVTALAGDRLDNSHRVPATAVLFAAGYLLVRAGSVSPLPRCNGVSTKPGYYPRGGVR